MSAHQKWFLGTIIAIMAIMVPLLIWKWDRTPELSYVDGSIRYADGYTYITVANKPGTGTAIVSRIYFYVVDPAILAEIGRTDPRPQPPFEVSSPNNTDQVHFTNGTWDENGYYYFQAQVSYHVDPGKPNDFELGIVNPKWRGFEFRGTVIIPYNSKSDFRLGNVTISGR